VLFGCVERHYSVAPKRIGGLLLRFEARKTAEKITFPLFKGIWGRFRTGSTHLKGRLSSL
jgi:hypothetical protein